MPYKVEEFWADTLVNILNDQLSKIEELERKVEYLKNYCDQSNNQIKELEKKVAELEMKRCNCSCHMIFTTPANPLYDPFNPYNPTNDTTTGQPKRYRL